MRGAVITSPDDHHWVLLDHRVTQVVVEVGAVRIHTWTLDASTELRLSAPFRLVSAGGGARALDPAESERLAPVLALLRRPVRSLTITRAGELTLELGDGGAVVVPASPRGEAWAVIGAGSLEGLDYRAPAAGAPAW
jgi:hypothetical protein